MPTAIAIRAHIADTRGVFASLTKIDVVATGPIYYQTDHRSRAEIEATPELSVLFALVRMCNARRYKPEERPVVIYSYAGEGVPAFIEEVVAAAGGLLASKGDLTGRSPAPTSAAVGEPADRAFRGLADRVQRRLGAVDATTALRSLEAEILAALPTQDADETRYWTCVLELSALTGEVLRAAHPGTWIGSESPDLVFAFSRGRDNVALITNRAQRFIDDGDPGESMFLLVASSAAIDDHVETFAGESETASRSASAVARNRYVHSSANLRESANTIGISR